MIDCMVSNIHIEVDDDEQYERLSSVKKKHGLTWRGMLLRAADDLENRE
jgi:hypothetical protein